MSNKEIERLYEILERLTDEDEKATLRHAIFILENQDLQRLFRLSTTTTFPTFDYTALSHFRDMSGIFMRIFEKSLIYFMRISRYKVFMLYYITAQEARRRCGCRGFSLYSCVAALRPAWAACLRVGVVVCLAWVRGSCGACGSLWVVFLPIICKIKIAIMIIEILLNEINIIKKIIKRLTYVVDGCIT